MSAMPEFTLEEDSIDEILYLSRANETAELEDFLSELASQTHRSKEDLVLAAIDPYSKNSALHYAAANGHTDVIKLLLSYKLDKTSALSLALINAINDAGNTALHWAALNGHLESVKQLVQAGADVTIINKAGHDAVFEAEINDKKDVVDWLLETVEELEKGIGQTDEASSDGEDEQAEAKSDNVNNSSKGNGGEGEAGVEGVRNQMEGMKTTDRDSQGG